jgi:zinc protease
MDELLPKVSATFATWQGDAPPPPPPAAPSPTPPARHIVIVDRPDLGQAQIAFGQDGISRSDPQRYAATVVTAVLGDGGFASRLMARVRAEEGLTYSIGSGFAMRREGGPFLVSTFTRVPEARRAIDLVLDELGRIRSEPPSEQELEVARSTLTGGFALGLETSAAIADALVSLDVQGLPESSLDAFRGRIRAVDRTTAEAVARERISPERMAIVVVGPAEALRPQLEGLGPIEVVAP